jgi:hypothetical protein
LGQVQGLGLARCTRGALHISHATAVGTFTKVQAPQACGATAVDITRERQDTTSTAATNGCNVRLQAIARSRERFTLGRWDVLLREKRRAAGERQKPSLMEAAAASPAVNDV